MFLSMPVYSSKGVTTVRGSDPVLTALFWVVVCSPKGERNKAKAGRTVTPVWWQRGVHCAEQPKQTPLKQRGREAAEVSLLALQLLPNSSFMVFLSLLPGDRRRQRLVFLQVFLSCFWDSLGCLAGTSWEERRLLLPGLPGVCDHLLEAPVMSSACPEPACPWGLPWTSTVAINIIICFIPEKKSKMNPYTVACVSPRPKHSYFCCHTDL